MQNCGFDVDATGDEQSTQGPRFCAFSLVITTMARHLPCVKRLMDIQRYLLSPFSFHIEEQKIPELRHQKQKCYSRIMNSDIVISVAQVTNISA